jgi:hypothetical protein
LEFPLLGGVPLLRGPSHDAVGQFPHKRSHSRASNLPSATESSAWPAVCLWYSYHSLSACSLRAGVSRWSLQLDPCERPSELSFGVWPGCGFRSTLRNSRCQGIPRLNRTRSVWLYFPPSFGSVERSNILTQSPSQRTCRQGRVLCVGGDGCMLFVLPIVGWLVKVSMVVE